MDKNEAREIVRRELDEYRKQSFNKLSRLVGEQIVVERTGPSGTAYQIEVEGMWDDPRKVGGDLRVMAAIDDGTLLGAFSPLTEGFIITPGGRFSGDES
ncbi:MAG: hypothetical protein ACRDFQ_00280 [Anaerolineales bacterium]